MSLLPWKKNQQKKRLSAYLDGELDPQKILGLGEHLVFDNELRQRLAEYNRADEIVAKRWRPQSCPTQPNSPTS